MFLMDPMQELLAPSALTTVFQPIFDISQERPALVAVEALTRGPQGTHFESASVLFEYIRLKHAEIIADRLCVAAAFRRAAEIPGLPLLSVNVHATTIERDSGFASFIEEIAEETGIDPRRVIVEIVEQSSYWNEERLRATLSELRAIGVRIAVDDLGFGNGNYRLILDARPDYLKIDRHFVDGCARDSYRRSLLKSILQLGLDCGAKVVAEGIERLDDLRAIRDVGITGGQGYLLGHPTASPSFAKYDFAPCLEESELVAERSY